MSLWNSISTARYASDTLFAADLTLDLLGRDFGQTMFSNPGITSATGSTFEAWTDLTSIWVAFPESWGLDLGFPAFPRITLPLKASLGGTEWADVTVFNLRLTADGDIVSCPRLNTDQDVTLTLDYKGTLPTGVTELKIQYYLEPAATLATCSVNRSRVAFGVDAWLGFVQP